MPRIATPSSVCTVQIACNSRVLAAAVAELMDAAAARAADRGALALAAEFVEHGLWLPPAADAEQRRRRALTHIRLLASAGEMTRALELADRLVAELPPGPGRAEALVERAQLEDEDIERREVPLERALNDAGTDEPLRGRVLDQLGWLRGIFRGALRAGIECAREALVIAQRVGDRDFEMSAAAGLSNMETLAGNPRPELMARAVELEDEIGRPPLWAGPRVLFCRGAAVGRRSSRGADTAGGGGGGRRAPQPSRPWSQGRTNREIGEALFMSVATVEAHLTRTHRKLDIRSRSQLTRLVTDGILVLTGRVDPGEM